MTFAKSAAVSGTSLHTGEKVTLKVQPAPPNSGIKIQAQGSAGRTDDRCAHRKSENGRARDDDRRRLGARAHRRACAGRALRHGSRQRDRRDGCERTADRRWQRATIMSS